MEMYSLEEDEGNALFITQERRNLVPLVPNWDKSDANSSETGGFVEAIKQYSDISDDDAFEISSSQIQFGSEKKR